MAGRDKCYTQGLIFYLALFSGRHVLMAARITWTLFLSNQLQKRCATVVNAIETKKLTFTKVNANRIWWTGFALQLLAYSFLAVNLIWKLELFSFLDSDELKHCLFNLTIAGFSLFSLFGITRCRDLDELLKFRICFLSVLFFVLYWFAFFISLALLGVFAGPE